MEYFNEVCKEEGVYELSIGWKSGGGHATILQRFADGKLRYIEPQSDNSAGSGMEWKDVKYLCEIGAATSHSCRGILRIDNKLFDVSFLDISTHESIMSIDNGPVISVASLPSYR